MDAGRVAAFDIGSNSIKMTIARVDAEGRVVEERSALDTVRLGEGVDRTGRLADERIAAALEAIGRMSGEARLAGATALVGVATEAVRIAENGAGFLAQVEDRFGVDVITITGEREAELTYAGLATMRELSGPVVMVDIGGGSTEVVTGHGAEMLDSVSIPLGSGRLTDAWISCDPPAPNELTAARAAAGAALDPLELERKRGARLIVSGGAGSYLGAFLGRERDLTPEQVEDGLQRMAVLAAADLARRLDVPVARARILPAGVTIVLAAIERLDPGSIEVAPSGLRIGLLQAAARGTL